MRGLALMVRGISGLNRMLGFVFSFFALAIVVVCFTVVVMRYGFRTGSVPMQDLYVWLNGMMFMGIAGYTLLRDGHVRVDIFYREAPARRRAVVDIVGVLVFVLPFLFVLSYYAWPYVMRSVGMREGSPNFGGLRGFWVLKSFLLVFVAVVGLQALAMLLRGVLVLADREELLPEDLRYPRADPDAEPAEPGV